MLLEGSQRERHIEQTLGRLAIELFAEVTEKPVLMLSQMTPACHIGGRDQRV